MISRLLAFLIIINSERVTYISFCDLALRPTSPPGRKQAKHVCLHNPLRDIEKMFNSFFRSEAR